MKHILVVGNSRPGMLRSALTADPLALELPFEVSFFATLGGSGPYARPSVEGLEATEQISEDRVFWVPPEASRRPLASYDAILISALGFIDGWKVEIPAVSRVRLLPFGPLGDSDSAPISEGRFREVIAAALDAQPGFHFLRALRQAYQGEIIVQPFPYHPASVVSRPDWQLAKRYSDPVGLYKLLCEIKDSHLERVTRELGVTLLDYPDPKFRETRFTPDELIDPRDQIHPTAEYGGMVLRQVGAALGAKRPAARKRRRRSSQAT